jgi:hypothetical protein
MKQNDFIHRIRASLTEGRSQSCFKKYPKCNSSEGVQGFLGVQILDFFIPRYKSREFIPTYKLLHPWV